MAIHNSISSMLKESLPELINVAEYCINFHKDPVIWGSDGCYGYPAAILLFSIADNIGSYVINGGVRKHFDILKHKKYYNLNLRNKEIDIIYKSYRCSLTHNAVLGVNVALYIGKTDGDVFEFRDSMPYINLLPFLNITKKAVKIFLEDL
jgi:hypothetical protein